MTRRVFSACRARCMRRGPAAGALGECAGASRAVRLEFGSQHRCGAVCRADCRIDREPAVSTHGFAHGDCGRQSVGDAVRQHKETTVEPSVKVWLIKVHAGPRTGSSGIPTCASAYVRIDPAQAAPQRPSAQPMGVARWPIGAARTEAAPAGSAAPDGRAQDCTRSVSGR